MIVHTLSQAMPSSFTSNISVEKAGKEVNGKQTVKLLVLALGAGGLATLWEAVFADVGVALIAIVNAIRVQKLIK